LLREVLNEPLKTYDALFTEEAALNVAAGVFFFGRKSLPGPSDVIPSVIQAVWEEEPAVKSLFPQVYNIGAVPNIMLWAKSEGRRQFDAIDGYFQNLTPFRKNEAVDNSGLGRFNSLPVISPDFIAVPGSEPMQPLPTGEASLRQRVENVATQNEKLEAKLTELTAFTKHQAAYIEEKEEYIKRLEALASETTAQRIQKRMRRALRA
jgi:hypothetical protein